MASLTFLGHSAALVDTGRHRVLLDPFLSGNPVATQGPDQVQCEAILVSHGHYDHLGDTVAIARRTGALVVTTFELAGWLEGQGLQVHPMNLGGFHKFEFGGVKLTPAFHSGGVEGADLSCTPCGFLLTFEGKTLFYSGDTALTLEFELIGRMHTIDLALLPIGDNFTMGPLDALEAVKMLHAKRVVPVHYGTWELIAQDAQQFKRRVESMTSARVTVVEPGGTMEF